LKAREQHQIVSDRAPAATTGAQAEAKCDEFQQGLTATPVPARTLVMPNDPSEIGPILFGKLAALWERDYVQRAVGGKPLLAASTKQKYRHHLHKHILPRWASRPLGEFRAKEILDWLQEESGSWFMMTDLRNIMSGIFTKAQEWEVLPDTFANPIARVKLPKKWQVYERRILTEEETVRVLALMRDPHRLICELCLATGARISEVTGLQVKHVTLESGCIRIEQRHWRGDIDSPKTERSKRTLTLGTLAERLKQWIESLEDNTPEAWVFPQRNQRKPMWDSGVRAALKEAARRERCDFPGFGLHSLRRANITWRQEVGGSSIEASRIAGHASTKMTEEYTVVQLNRQEELTRRIQEKLSRAASRLPNQNWQVPRLPPGRPNPIISQNYLASGSRPSDGCDVLIDQERRRPVLTFIIDRENQIRVVGSDQQRSKKAADAFTTKRELERLAGGWPAARLVEIWNRVPGVKRTKKFTDRKTAINRIWKTIQPSGLEMANTNKPVRGVTGATKPKGTHSPRRSNRELQKVRAGSKKAEILKLLHRPSGVTLQQLMAATGWQAHSVRGFISAGVGKRMGLKVASARQEDGQRVYQIR